MDQSANLTLSRLLSRLEHSLLSPAAETKLRRSSYERKRISTNIEHARSLLLTLEKQSSTIRVQTQKQQAQVDLNKKRDVIKRLNARMQELDSLGEDDNDTDTDEEEELSSTAEETNGQMASFAPARSNINAGLNIGEAPDDNPQPEPQQNELRARRPLQSSDNRSTATTTARQELFAGRKQHLDLETSEALMTHNNHEQELLTNGLLGLARALKESSLSFASSLESEKEIMRQAEGGLDKSAQGMEQAERKMGMLRRMSEGQGWWGRIKLYGFIAGLWLACFLLVFLGPKLRF
ncbi:hypothetical protein AMS68_001653 [Peltaster fructicola]|uniref:Synaptobrevin n=1 Tax=Peltaster fructicola TaxID=286661 RepID=A0A6H0XN56_9PEZI|nr:hypothetical protein AMS68_001653 [Peltaster fructicola]